LITGLGKSGLIGAKISATLASIGIPSHPVHPSEAAHGDLGRFRASDCVIAISYSGETDEVVNLVAILRQDGIPIVSITGANRGEPSTLEQLLAERLVRAQLSLEPRRIADIFTELLVEARGASSARVLGRREDLAALRETLGALGLPEDAVALVEDAGLTRGSLVLESDLGTVDGRLETRLDRLAEALVAEVRAQARRGEPR
jgi:hypothetical protein